MKTSVSEIYIFEPWLENCSSKLCPKRPGSPLCGDMWVCHMVIALKRVAPATTCTAKERSRVIMDRSAQS